MDISNTAEKHPLDEGPAEDPTAAKKVRTEEIADIKDATPPAENAPAVNAPVTEPATERRTGIAPVKAE